jgi:hypothetical protein
MRWCLLGGLAIVTHSGLSGCSPSLRAKYELTLHNVTPRAEQPNETMAVAFGLDQPALAAGSMFASAR